MQLLSKIKFSKNSQPEIPSSSALDSVSFRDQRGFTLMEIMVATVIFAITAVAMLSLFNYVLKINRRSEALRQASQGARNFVEFIVKEVRNGQIDYYVNSGKYVGPISASSPCVPPLSPPAIVPASNAAATYGSLSSIKDNKLGIFNTENVEECFFYGKKDGTYVDSIGTAPATFGSSGGGSTLAMQKSGVTGTQILNPPNFRIDNLMFIIRPTCDPYTPDCAAPYSNSYPRIQPVVTILMKFVVQLPTGEQVSIFYQTSVSSNKYDISH